MDTADIEAFLGVGRCPLGQETSALQKLEVTNDLLDFFQQKPAHTMVTDVTHIWEETRRVCRAVLWIGA